jgi:hypothetical protein
LDGAVTGNPSANAFSPPVISGLPEQSVFAYSATVECSSALPLILTSVAGDGEAGLEASVLGAVGAVESLTKLKTDEHAEVLPSALVAVAENDVVASAITVTASPAAKFVAESVVTGSSAQAALA